MDLIPYYSRLVATLAPCIDDMVPTLVDILLRDLRFQIRKKDQLHIHSKLKNIRFLGEWGLWVWHGMGVAHISLFISAELTKFGICPKPEAMKCITVIFGIMACPLPLLVCLSPLPSSQSFTLFSPSLLPPPSPSLPLPPLPSADPHG